MKNDARWSSVFQTVIKYYDLVEFINLIAKEDDKI